MNIMIRSSLATFVLTALVLVGTDWLRAETPAASPAAAQSVAIPVKGMSCMACVAKTKQTLRAVPGVNEVEVKLNPGSAIVKYDASKVTAEKLVAVIKELGYEAELPAAKNGQ